MGPMKLRVDEIAIPSTQVRGLRSTESLEGLANSMSEVGLLHPILVKPVEKGYELVAGLRRLMAARQAGYTHIPAIPLSAEMDTLQVQLVENLQREDLNPVERAQAVDSFMRLHKLSKSEAARRLGVPRTTLTDWLDLLCVPHRFQAAVVDNFNGGDSPLTTSHVSEALALAKRLNSPKIAHVLLDAVLKHKLSKAETREVARMVRQSSDTSIEEAIEAVRAPYFDGEDDGEDPSNLLPHEENMKALILNLARSTRMLERMNHLSGRFLNEETVTQLVEQYTQIAELTERALARLRMEEPELLERAERKVKARTGRPRRHHRDRTRASWAKRLLSE